MGGKAKQIVNGHGLAAYIEFHCADATTAEVEDVSIAWLNDFAWPSEHKRKMLFALAENLPNGALVVTPKGDLKEDPLNGQDMDDFVPLVLTGSMGIPVSWSKEQVMHVLCKDRKGRRARPSTSSSSSSGSKGNRGGEF